MRQRLIEQAINEQVRGFVPEEGLDSGIRYKRLTKRQIWRSRRSTEAIMVDMADKMKTWNKPDRCKSKKSRSRRRRRGPRVLVASCCDQINEKQNEVSFEFVAPF